MPARQTPSQKQTVQRVMHEFKHGELKTARGTRKVKSRKQAVAIALHEAGASKSETPKKNARNLRHTKAKERRGETYKDEAEGRKGRTARAKSAHSASTTKSRRTATKAKPTRSTGKTRTRTAASRSSATSRRSTAARSTSARARATSATARGRTRRSDGKTKAQLYAEAKRRNIPGRSKMNKAQLERALHK